MLKIELRRPQKPPWEWAGALCARGFALDNLRVMLYNSVLAYQLLTGSTDGSVWTQQMFVL